MSCRGQGTSCRAEGLRGYHQYIISIKYSDSCDGCTQDGTRAVYMVVSCICSHECLMHERYPIITRLQSSVLPFGSCNTCPGKAPSRTKHCSSRCQHCCWRGVTLTSATCNLNWTQYVPRVPGHGLQTLHRTYQMRRPDCTHHPCSTLRGCTYSGRVREGCRSARMGASCGSGCEHASG